MDSTQQSGIFPRLHKFYLQELSFSEEEFPGLLFLSVIFGCFFLIFFIVLHLPHGVQESEELQLYVEGWLLIPLMTMLGIWGVHKIHKFWLNNQPVFIPALVLVDSLALGIMISIVHYIWMTYHSFLILARSTALVLVIFPLLNLAVFYYFKKHPQTLLQNQTRFQQFAYTLFPLIGLICLVNFGGVNPFYGGSTSYTIPPLPILVAIFLGAVSLVHLRVFAAPSQKNFSIVLDGLALMIILLASFDPLFSTDIAHQNFYLGPVNDLLRGKTILVNTFSQYGVLSILFLSTLFQTGIFPLDYQGLSLIISLLYMAQFALLYGITKTLVKSSLFAMGVLILILVVNLFATMGIAQAYPSIGPLRFGLSYLLLGIIILRYRYSRMGKLFALSEYLLIGIASIWSFETFIYTITMYMGVILVESLRERPGLRNWIKILALRGIKIIASIVLMQALFCIFTLIRTGTLPLWDHYLDLILKYSQNEFGTLPIDTWSPWVLIVSVYFISLISFFIRVVYLKQPDASLETVIIQGLTFLGVAQLTYYIGRSHPNNLLHISVPAILIASFWVSRYQRTARLFPEGFQRAGLYAFYCLAALMIVTTLPVMKSKYENTGFAYVQKLITASIQQKSFPGNLLSQTLGSLKNPVPSTPRSKDALQMIQKYWGHKSKVAAFITPDDETEALILSKKTHIYPIGHPTQDDLSSLISAQILSSTEQLEPGDNILILTVPDESLVRLQKQVLQMICNQFDFKEIKRTPHGLSVMKIKTQTGASDNYCTELKNLDP